MLVGTHGGAIVALAQYVRLRDRRSAEAAFADAGFAQTRAVEAGVVEVRLALAPTHALLVRVPVRYRRRLATVLY